MSFSSDLRAEVRKIFRSVWTIREGKAIPDVDDLKLTNDAVTFEAVVLYADLADSTGLVTAYKPEFAAEIYKTYLIACCRIIAKNSGEITAFDGDRVMAVFFEGAKNTNAAKTALNINWAVTMANEELKEFYSTTTFKIQQAVGIDSGKLFVAKTGIRGANDLVWVGPAANLSAKLCALRDGYFVSWMTDSVYSMILDEAKFANGQPMWTQKYWTEYGRTVYASSYQWEP
jgi:class 3 adenylate cyclase